jgi:lysozyme
MPLRIVDISNWQPQADYLTIAASDVQGLIMKATEGIGYRDALLDTHRAGARGAGLVTGYYHYARPELSEAIGEARYFVDQLGEIAEGESLWLDMESAAEGNLAPWALACLEEIERLTGITPGLYSYPWYFTDRRLNDARLARFPLWFADYGAPDPIPAPWTRYTLRQITADAYIPGLGPKIDLNIFDGTIAELRALGKAAPRPADPVALERAALLAYGESRPFDTRGIIEWEGEIDCSEWGGATAERFAKYERCGVHRLRGRNFTIRLAEWDRLRGEGKIRQYPSGSPVALGAG